MMSPMDATQRRLVDLVAGARKAVNLERQIDLANATGLSKSTIHRFEKEGKAGAGALRAISWAVRWTPDSAADVLAGGDPTPATEAAEPPASSGPALEQRHRRGESATDAGAGEYEIEFDPEVGTIVHNTVYEVIGVLEPDMPLSRVREIEALALEAVRRRGGNPRRRHNQASDDTSTGTDNRE